MAITYIDFPPATAGQTDFEFTFPYLEDEHVKVEINGVNTTAFTISTTPTTKVVLNAPGATAGDQVRVRRRSAPNQNLVDFVNGSVLTESELDLAYRHNRYLSEEIAELNDASLQVEAGGTQWDAKGLRIKNVGSPTDTTDATTKLYVDNKVNQGLYGSDAPLKWQFPGTAGTNTTYTVTGAAISGDTVYDVSINGLVQEPTVDYTVNPDTDTLTIKTTLVGGEDIVVIQRGFGVAVTGTVGTNSLVDGSVTNPKLAADSVTSVKLATGAVTTAKIAANAVDGTKIADGAVTNSKIGADAVDGTKIADDSIDSEHYVDGSIDNAHIADGAITSGKISTTDSVFNIKSDGRVAMGTTSHQDRLVVQFDEDNSSSQDYREVKGITIRNASEIANTFMALKLETPGSQVAFVGERITGDLMNLHIISEAADGVPNTLLTFTDNKIGVRNKTPLYDLDVLGYIHASLGVLANNVILTSDDRVKHNQEVISNALETLLKLTPKKYIKTVEMYETDHNFELDAEGKPVNKEVEYKVEAGVIAQEVLKIEELAFAVTPETKNENGEVVGPHGVNYNSLFTYAVAAIKEQQAIIEDLKARVEALEN